VDGKDFEVLLDDGELVVRGEKRAETEDEARPGTGTAASSSASTAASSAASR
jgi:HSP20 family molecular chaperone IbpA